jgi:fructose-1,6-bisphosphatase/inositol monophosphatase family enzyme
MAEKGGGAVLRRPSGGEERLRVAAAPPLEQMVGTVSVAYLPAESKPLVLANLAKVRVAANYRCAGHDYRLLAGGHTHFSMYNKLMPWDHLAGALIVQEAGGYAARLDGSAYRTGHRDGGLLLAPDAESWGVLRREVFTV